MVSVVVSLGLLAGVLLGVTAIPAAAEPRPAGPAAVIDRGVAADVAREQGPVPVIVELRHGTTNELRTADDPGPSTSTGIGRQRADAVLARLPERARATAQRFERRAMVALEVDDEGLAALASDPDVAAVRRNGRKTASLAQATATIGAPAMWSAGSAGSGQTVAIVDTGVSRNHPFLAGSILAEGCFTSTTQGSTPVCPGPDPTVATGVGTGGPCPVQPSCNHGTHVAGIAAGGAGGSFSGVAPGAAVIAVNVFSMGTTAGTCASGPPCVLAWDADIIRGLDYVASLVGTYQVAAVNLSLGGGGSTGTCDDDAERPAIDRLRALGVPTVVSSGNLATSPTVGKGVITAPACVSSAVAVAATDDTADTVPAWVQTSKQLAFYAPGLPITSSVAVPGPTTFSCPAPFNAGSCASLVGTSMAAPMVTGAIALVRARQPSAPGVAAVDVLRNAGRPVTDPANGVTAPRVALDSLVRPPTFHPVDPSRLLDTRDGTGAPAGRVGPGGSVETTVTGRGGVPATGVSAVVLNVTAVLPSEATFVTAHAAGTKLPASSNLNVDAGAVRANLVVTKVSGGGRVALYNSAGTVDLAADVAGWYDHGGPVAGAAGGASFASTSPLRVLDTRDGTGTGRGAGPLVAGTNLTFVPTPAGACPGTGPIVAVALNLTVTAPTATTHLTAWPAGHTRPVASNLNASAGAVLANLAVVSVGTGGRVAIAASSGSLHVIADLEGCWRASAGSGGAPAPGGTITTIPARILDTRTGLGGVSGSIGPAAPNGTISVPVLGRAGIPASGVAAVILNVTVTEATAASHLTVWPGGQGPPDASTLNMGAGQTVANLVVVRVGPGGAIQLANHAGSTQVVADVAGYVAA